MRNGAPGLGDRPSDESSETIIGSKDIPSVYIQAFFRHSKCCVCVTSHSSSPGAPHACVRTSINCNTTREYSICKG